MDAPEGKVPGFESHISTDHGPPPSVGMAWVVSEVPRAETILRLPASSSLVQLFWKSPLFCFSVAEMTKDRENLASRPLVCLTGLREKSLFQPTVRLACNCVGYG